MGQGGGSRPLKKSAPAVILRVVAESIAELIKIGKCLFALTRDDSICDVWLFRQDFNISDVILQENETTDAKYALPNEIRAMVSDRDFIAFHYIEDLFEKTKALK